ncbi:MAG: hypothetical protein ACE5GO_00040 [Anaerolineales bacterium]
MTELLGPLLLTFFREAWLTLAGVLLLLVLMGILAQVLKASTAATLGTNYWVAQAVMAAGALVGLALFAFLGVPVIVAATLAALPESVGCGPLVDLGTLSASLVGALAGLRMLKALVSATAAAAAGGTNMFTTSLLEVGEALFGMILTAAVVPIAAHFLGVC